MGRTRRREADSVKYVPLDTQLLLEQLNVDLETKVLFFPKSVTLFISILNLEELKNDLLRALPLKPAGDISCGDPS